MEEEQEKKRIGSRFYLQKATNRKTHNTTRSGPHDQLQALQGLLRLLHWYRFYLCVALDQRMMARV